MAHSSRPMPSTCKECGWQCKNCTDQTNLHLHVEIENLKQRLLEREHHIVSMETNFLNEAEKFPNGEFSALTEELLTWQEKYSRLYESHKRVQKVNQSLEDKLLRIVDKCETEKSSITQDLASLTQRLVEARSKVKQLEDENERYRNDVNLAIQLLQCKPTNFVSQKLDTLSPELQQKVRTYIGNKRTDGNGSCSLKPEPKIIKVPIPTFPPTAMVYSLNNPYDREDASDGKSGSCKQPVDIVSAAIMAKVLEERARERLYTKHCETCTCSAQQQNIDSATQTFADQSDCITYTNNIANSSNRGSQGLVRYIDVVTTRSSNESLKSNQSFDKHIDNHFLSSKSWQSPAMSHAKSSQYIAQSSLGADIVTSVRSIDSMKLKDPRLMADSGYSYQSQHLEDKRSCDVNNPSARDNDVSNCLSLATASIKLGKAPVPGMVKSNVNVQDDVLWSNLSSSSVSTASSQISIDMEAIGEQSPAFSSVPKCRDVAYGSLEDNNKKLQSYFGKNEPTRARNQEGRTFLSDKINNTNVDISKTTNPNKTVTQKVDITDDGRSKLAGRRLGTNRRSVRQMTDTPGPRACSLRMQAGTSNILLANATCYTPVLYTSRPDVLVHSPRSRSTSASSSDAGITET